MSAIRVRALLLVIFAMVFIGRSPAERAAEHDDGRGQAPDIHSASAALAKMPIRFEANVGQHDDGIRFVARRGAAAIALRDDGATLVIQQRTGPKKRGEIERRANRVVIGLTPDGARAVTPRADGELVTRSSYFVGNEPSKWRSDIRSYAKVTYPSILDGVDLVYHGENGALEYDFVVAPGAKVDSVAMNVEGASKLSITDKGELRIHTYAGDIVQPPPVVYQRDARGDRREIGSSYRLADGRKVGFEVSTYDRTQPLVIDPVLGYATYLGGTGYDVVTAVAADAMGNTFVTGLTYSTDFPTANAYDPTFNVYNLCQDCPVGTDTFVAKLDPSGSQLLYATYLGGGNTGGGDDMAMGIAVGADGTAYVTGDTSSYDFPMVNPLPLAFRRGFNDGFVSRLSADGTTLLYSTYLSGQGEDEPRGIKVDASGIYIAGTTTSGDIGMPPQQEAIVPMGGASGGLDRDGFILKLTPSGNAITYVKYLGGTSDELVSALAIDAAGSAYVAGYTYSADFPQSATALKPSCQGQGWTDAFAAKLDATGETFTFATCFGGTSHDFAQAIAVDGTGAAYVAGVTTSADFPAPSSIQPFGGASDAFVSKIAPAGATLQYSTFIGGNGDDAAYGIAVDSANTAWITGTTSSANYPLVAAIQPVYAGGGESGNDAFVTRVDATGSALLFSSYLGGATEYDEGAAIAVSGSSVHVGGNTFSTDVPLFNARQQTNAGEQDGFVAKITVPPLMITPTSILVPVGSNAQFSAAGGAGFGYVFSLQTNASGGSISSSGAYTAGNTGSTVDIVRVTDASGLTTTATVQVGPNTTPLVISPTNTSVSPKGQRLFTASGGVPPYGFSFASNASGGTITPSGTYTAGTKGGVTDIVRLTDGAGANVQATVTVGPAISITPAKPAAPPKGSVSFSATGGSGSGYAWALATNGSGGSIVAGTGQYTAGSGSNTVDTVQVTDSLGNKATVNVSVGGGLAVTPSDPTITTKGSIAFTAVGGSGVYTWSLTTAASGGSIVASSGAYTAGATGNTIDVVRVQDSVGNSSTVQVTVGPSLTIDPQAATVLTGAKVAFAAAGGSGTGYAFSVPSNPSGGAVGPDGVYFAGGAAGVDVVRLTDSLGNAAEATVTVNAPPGGATLPDGGVAPGFDAGTIPGLNIGGGGVNEDCSCRAAGASNGTGPARGLAALAFVLGLVVRRRRGRADRARP